MMRILGAALLLAAAATAQDTYKCADGWALEEDRSGCRCFLFAEGEAVMKDTADLLCKAHEGWVAELDHPGVWWWEHRNETVSWFDWADGQPDNYHGEDCLTLEEYHDPFFPIARDYFWNDRSCDHSAHYICERPC